MTVANENSVIQYTLTSGTQNLPTNYYFLLAADLKVKKTVAGVETTLVLNSDYSVNLPLVDAGNGSIDMITGTIGDIVTVENCPPRTQATDYVENDRFPADSTERALDKLTMLINKIATALFGNGAVLSRFIQYPSTELTTNAVTPSQADRMALGAGTLAAFKGSDGAIDSISKGSVGVGLTLSTDTALGGGSPDAVNGVTQLAVKTYIDTNDATVQAELDATQAGVGGIGTDGNYVVKSGTNYIDGNASLNEDITDLDTALDGVDTRVTTLEGAEAFESAYSASINNGTGSQVYTNLTLPATPTGRTAAQIRCVLRSNIGDVVATMTIKDSDSNEIVVTEVDGGVSTGSGSARGTDTIFIYVGGATTEQVKVDVSAGTLDTWQVDLVGWM